MSETFTIKEMAEHTGVSLHTLRYYEREGLLPSVSRQENGYRLYTMDDVGWVNFVKCLRDTGMSISQIRQYVELMQEGEHTSLDRQRLLEDHQCFVEEQLREWEQKLKMIRNKINHYQRLTEQSEPTG
jgi:DNA-binding transcriptional MerR regulator